jgi:hypothetical protein
MSAMDELAKLLDESGVTITIDRFRDVTKGCGDDCRGMNPSARNWCPNHLGAILRGDYLVKGGMVAGLMDLMRKQMAEYERAAHADSVPTDGGTTKGAE